MSRINLFRGSLNKSSSFYPVSSNSTDNPMAQDKKNTSEQTAENSSLANGEQAKQKQTGDTREKTANLENELAHVTASLQDKAKKIGSDALDLARHHSRYAEMGTSLAESMAGESLGEIVGASLGTVFGPEGTVIGAELGGMAGEVFGARQGDKVAKKLLDQTGTEPPLKEDLQKEGSAKIGEKAVEKIGGLVGDILFDEAGGEIGEAVGEKIGKLAGTFVYEHIEKVHYTDNKEPASNNNPQINSDLPKD